MSVARGYPPRPFCPNCILWFDTPEALTQHVTTDPEHTPYICETCGLHTFLTLEELKYHQVNCSTSQPYQTKDFCPECVVWYGSGREALEKHWREGNCSYKPRNPQPQAPESTMPAGAGTQPYGHSTHDGTRNADARPRSTAVPTNTADSDTDTDSGENPGATSMTPDDSDQESEEEEEPEARRSRRGEGTFEASWHSDED